MSRSELSRKIQAGNGHVNMVKILIKDLKLPGTMFLSIPLNFTGHFIV